MRYSPKRRSKTTYDNKKTVHQSFKIPLNHLRRTQSAPYGVQDDPLLSNQVHDAEEIRRKIKLQEIESEQARKERAARLRVLEEKSKLRSKQKARQWMNWRMAQTAKRQREADQRSQHLENLCKLASKRRAEMEEKEKAEQRRLQLEKEERQIRAANQSNQNNFQGYLSYSFLCKIEECELVPGLELAHREKYLTPQEFEEVFGLSRKQFLELPEWKQVILKQHSHLF